MVKCPKCKKEIDCLNNVQSGHNTYIFMVIEGEVEYELDGFEATDSVNDWRCPKCDEIIATTEQQAVKFLSEKDLSHKEAIELGMKVEE